MKLRQRFRRGCLILSFFLFPVTIYYFSPYIPVLAAISGIVAGSLFTFTFMFLVSLIAGRIICAYLCPAGGFQEICAAVNNKPVKKGRWLKFAIWAPWIVLLIFFFNNAGGIKEYDFFYLTTNGISIAEPKNYIIYYGVGSIFAVLAFAVGRRSACHHICWMAPFMIIGKKISALVKSPHLHISAEKEKCTNCMKCTRICTMSLDVHELVKADSIEHHDCILCGECIDNCPQNVLSYNFGR